MTHLYIMTLVNSPLANGNLDGALNTRRYTLVQGFCLFWLFLMEGKRLRSLVYLYTPSIKVWIKKTSCARVRIFAVRVRVSALNPLPPCNRLAIFSWPDCNSQDRCNSRGSSHSTTRFSYSD